MEQFEIMDSVWLSLFSGRIWCRYPNDKYQYHLWNEVGLPNLYSWINKFYVQNGQIYFVTTASGIFRTDGSLFKIPAAVNEVIYKDEFELFPNPLTNELKFKTSRIQEFSYEIFNSTGESMIKGDINIAKSNSIDLTNLNIGFYFIRIKTENDSFSKKLIKQ